MTHRMKNILAGRRGSYRMAGYEEDDDLEASDEECAAFLAATAPNRVPQDLSNPVLTLGSNPLPPRPCSWCPHSASDDRPSSLLRRWSGRDQHVLDLLQEIMLTPRKYSDFDFYAALIPGLVSPNAAAGPQRWGGRGVAERKGLGRKERRVHVDGVQRSSLSCVNYLSLSL